MRLEIILIWPTPLIDSKVMHEKWLMDPFVQCEESHLAFVKLAKAMNAFRLRSSDWIESK